MAVRQRQIRSDSEHLGIPSGRRRARLHDIIFEAETPEGKAFDVVLLVLILLSVFAVLLESVAGIRARWGPQLKMVEWGLTLLFSVEYLLRIVSVRRPKAYVLSFYGIVDLLSILPTYLSLFIVGSHSLLVIRALRLLRVFRILKMVHFVHEAGQLYRAMRGSIRKITIFLGAVLTVVLIVGALMYWIEGEASGFTSIPQAMYWAIVTMTTVGYGDIAPQTVPGKLLASLVMILGYGIIAVPTGIVSAELVHDSRKPVTTHACAYCGAEGHDLDAIHCKICGEKL